MSSKIQEQTSLLKASPELSPMTQQALAFYHERLQALLEPEHTGQGLAIHPDSRDYVVAANPTQAGHLMRKRHPEGNFLTLRIGSQPDYGLAARFLAGQHLVGTEA